MKYAYIFPAALFCFLSSYTGIAGERSASAPAFMENGGQITDQFHTRRNDIQFRLGAANGLNIFVGNGALHYQFSSAACAPGVTDHAQAPDRQPTAVSFTMYRMDVDLVGADRNARVTTELPRADYERYYTAGTGPEGAVSRAYGKIIYHDVYPSIDWVLYTVGGALKHEFIVRPGGKVSDIKLAYSGASELRLTANGGITATTPQGSISENAPYAYDANGREVKSAFRLNGNTVSYDIDNYTGTLVIDPQILWSTYYGGISNDNNCSISPDINGNVYSCGNTASVASIATTGAFLTTYLGFGDAFLVKLRANGTRVWATYFGGAGGESGDGLATDLGGNVYVSGLTSSTAGMATVGAYQVVLGGGTDAYLVKFDSVGARMWSTYYGGDSVDQANTGCVAVDGVGNVFLGGQTKSIDSIGSTGAWQPTNGGGYDAFVAKFNTFGTFKWGSYYGGSFAEYGWGVTADLSGKVYISGSTGSSTGIASTGAYQATPGGGMADGFLAKLDSNGGRDWGTYFGNTGYDLGEAVRTDLAGNVYMTGRTNSSTGIATSSAWQLAKSTGLDCYLAKFTSAGSLSWATYYGSTGDDIPYSISADVGNNIYIAGFTGSPSGMATAGAYHVTNSGGTDGFVAQFTSAGARLWGTYIGDTAFDQCFAVGSGATNVVYTAGLTESPTNIATAGAHQTVYNGSYEGFMSKFDLTPTSLATIANEGARVYPVPAADVLNIVLTEQLTAPMDITLTDIAGRIYHTYSVHVGQQHSQMDVKDVPPGMYLVHLTAASINETLKVVIQR